MVLSAATRGAATLEDSARTEGEVVLYSSLNNEQIVTLVDAFKKKYPNIKPSFYRGTSERVLQRAVTEAKAGRFAVDVVTSAGFQMQLMKESGLTQRFVPPEASSYNEGFKDPDGHWVNVHSLLNSMAYNTQLVKPNEAPKKYEDLLAPRWKGRLGVNLQDPEWYVSLQRRWGKEKARNFLKALAAQQPGVRDGHNITAQLLAAGEFHAVTNTYAHIAARIKGQGGPGAVCLRRAGDYLCAPDRINEGRAPSQCRQTADEFYSFRRRPTHAARPGPNSQPPRRRSRRFFRSVT